MSLPKNKAEEILDFCLSKESPQIKAKVYEVISKSEIQPNDPMFLVLALTGQIRVLLEVAPSELRELLEVWQASLSQSMKELHEAIALVKEAQELQVESIKQSLEEINSQNVNNIRTLHQTLVGEILSTNGDIEDSVRVSVKEIKSAEQQLTSINSKLQSERTTNIQVMKSLIEGLTKTTEDLELANDRISSSISTLDKLKLSSIFNRWVILGSFIGVFVFSSLLTLCLVNLTNVEHKNASSFMHLILRS